MIYRKEGNFYYLNYPINFRSERYGEDVSLPVDYKSDGATRALDIFSIGWFVHDKLCDTGKWDSGKRLTNWQASRVLSDILWQEKRYFRAGYWLLATFLFGGGKARENGLFKLKKQGSSQ